MRLTFRRLLAYLDGVLEEDDVEVLGQKIQESDFATRLIHRIRNAKTRLRLGAPRLAGKGMGLDPNTVAEYLDYTLDEDRVADFEKVCLESDVHLAEVASSHEVLTLVLAEPAQVERSIRERMYNLPDEARSRQIETGNGARVQSDPAHSEHEESLETASAMREMNEMIEGREEVRWRSMLMTMALSFLLVIVGLRAVGPFDGSHPLIGRFLSPGRQVAGDGDVAPPALKRDNLQSPAMNPVSELDAAPQTPPKKVTDVIIPNGAPSSPGPPDVPGAPPVEPAGPPAPAAEPGAPPAPIEPGAPPAPIEPGAPPAPIEPGAPPAPIAEPGAPPAPIEPGAPPAPIEPGAPPTPIAEPGAPPAPIEPGALPAPIEPGAPPPPTTPPAVATAGEPAEPPATTNLKPGVDVGRFTSEHSVLTRWDQATASWRPLPSREVLRAGDRLLAPPAFRPQLALASGVQLIVVGPAELMMLPPQDGEPAVRVLHGRVLVETVVSAGAKVRLDLGGIEGAVVLKSVDASVAIEVAWYSPVGSDPRSGSKPAIRWSTLRGEAQWLTDGGAVSKLAAGERITAVDGNMMAPAAAPAPAWASPVAKDDMAKLDADAAKQELGKEFTPDRAASLTFEELLEHRMVNVQSLASRSLTQFGQFGPYIRSLNNVDMRRYWAIGYTNMRQSLSRGPQAAERLRKALQDEYPGEDEIIERLYRLCVSFNNEQLAAGEAGNLVSDLSHPEMAVRALAWENLRRITGKTHLFFPEKLPDQQRTSIHQWARSLGAGEIKWSALPQPFEEGT